MEKKTLGSFLSALRKANGLTQKELAEKLNVSDKAVSRWERDECAPDLTLIPVIAEIFGVTSDELLRGQRSNPDTPQPEARAEKSQKQIARILNENRTRLLSRSLITLGVALLGLIGAMICNLGFLRAYLGFFVGCGFYVAAGILESVFGVQAFSAVSGDEFEESGVDAHRKALRSILRRTCLAVLILFAVTLPLAIHTWDAYVGLSAGSWLLLGLIYGAASVGLFLLGQWFLHGMRLRRMSANEDPDLEKSKRLHRLQGRIIGFTALALLVTGFAQIAFNNYSSNNYPFAAGEVFHSIEEFRDWAIDDTGRDPVYDMREDTVEFYDENGEIISLEELYIKTESGLTIDRINAIIDVSRQNISYVQLSDDGHYFPITVYTGADVQWNYAMTGGINTMFIAVYIAEILLAVLIYRKKKKAL